MRVLVTDGDSRSALAIVRALGRAGHWVAVGHSRTPALAQASRYCSHRLEYPDPASQDQAFVHALVSSVAELGIDALLPVADITTLLVTQHRDRFDARCQIPFAPAAAIARAADKVDVLKTALRLGVPVPRTVFVNARPDAPATLDLSYPVVIKPHRSRTRTPQGWRGTTVSYARDPQDLGAQLAARHDAEFPLALQERIVGPGLGLFLCVDRGVIVARFCHRRLREKPPTGGVSVLSESIPIHDGALAHAEALLRDLDWFGVAMVEFKVDERDGIPKLMEINGRFWGSLQLAIDAGVDFPNILLRTLAGDPPAAPPAYKVGVRNRWLVGDLESLMIRLFGRSPLPGRAGATGRLTAVRDFLALWGRDLHYENPKRDDLGPFFHELRSLVKGHA
ncbi:MAG: ATP-grasp domain-containing protein [Vicinamibacterales bacterium]